MTIFEMESIRSVADRPDSEGAWVEARLDGGLIRVVADGQAMVCRKAVSCLLEPGPGDRVALHAADAGIVYVVAVLERPSSEPACVCFDRPLQLEVRGNFELQVQDSVSLQCGRAFAVQAEKALLSIESLELVVTSLQGLIGELGLRTGALRLVSKAIDTVAERLVQVLGDSYRSVDGMDQVRAERIDYAALEQLRLHARNALYTADQLAKIDAGQIHLG